MKFKKFLAMVLIGTMTFSLVACGSKESNEDTNISTNQQTNSEYDTLVVSVNELNGIFNPLFYTSAFDKYVFDPCFSTVCSLDDENNLIDNAGSITTEEIKDNSGNTTQVKYTIKLKDGVTFSDGTPVTIDDYIFSLKLAVDPTYDGMNTLSSLNIVGLKEYREGGDNVTEISGIEKIDDLTCTVLVDGVNIIGDRLLAEQYILPKHYYGISQDGKEYKKGDMTVPKSRNSMPMGSGPYIFKSYDKNIATLEANPNYFKGAPKTPNLKFQVVSENNKVDVVVNGEVDIADPSADKETMARLEAESIEYNLTDNNGYGYIGIDANRIPDINVRKGLMCLMNREPAVKSYFGDLAEVIERPMTSTLPEYPEGAKPYYQYDKAKALEYFEKAGYKKDSNGKLVDKNGNQLKVEVGVGDLKSHPTAGIFSQMKIDMEEMGAEFIVSDLQFNALSDRLNSGDLDMFALAWGDSNNCDLTQIFHSSFADKAGSNRYNLKDPEVDKLIEQVASTLDFEKRKELVAKELDLIMENAVIMPVYQRKNLNIFSDNLKIDTVYRTSSPYHTFRDEYHTIEMK
ncbi:ABC transporter substrate-binding protein [[Clostridium] colinum]|uniref:ABC transporter substrate-binding protein n=1 Tax=[Clostridium] colinum TaxID=36835 RepID=UPI00202520D2|nr:ABC transporter substrate-binding protein [[Clostridium] colinum]